MMEYTACLEGVTTGNFSLALCLEGSQPAPLQCDRIGQALAETVLALAMLLPH